MFNVVTEGLGFLTSSPAVNNIMRSLAMSTYHSPPFQGRRSTPLMSPVANAGVNCDHNVRAERALVQQHLLICLASSPTDLTFIAAMCDSSTSDFTVVADGSYFLGHRRPTSTMTQPGAKALP